jgi:hypothetical protein
LNLHQPTPSAGQPIGQIPPVTIQSNMQGSSALRVSAGVPNPQSRTLEEQPLETPSTDVQAIEQISTKLKSHLKEELIDHLSEMLQKLFGIKPKQQIYMYKTPYPSGYDQIPFPQRFKVPDFNKFSWQDDTSIMEHTTRFIIQCEKHGILKHSGYGCSLHLSQGQHFHGSLRFWPFHYQVI